MGMEDLDNNGAGAAGGDGGLDLSAAGESISADLFGSSTEGDDNGSGTDDVNLGDGAAPLSEPAPPLVVPASPE